MKTTVDAFGTEVIIGDTVVFMVSNRKSFEIGNVVKCTKHGATISCHRVYDGTCVNVRSERVYKVHDGQRLLELSNGKYVMGSHGNEGYVRYSYVPEVSE